MTKNWAKMHNKGQKLIFSKIVIFLLIEPQSKPSGTSRYLEIASISDFFVPNDFLAQSPTHINSHFGSDNFYQKGCTLAKVLLKLHRKS